MALFNEALVQEATALVRRRCNELAVALGHAPLVENEDLSGKQAPLATNLRLLIEIANGEQTRGEASPAFVDQVEIALQAVRDALFGNALHTPITIPDEFWSSEIGVLCSRVRWWISVDDLITISNAAALAFGENTQATRMRIVRAIDNGLLDWIPDPSVANPQQNRRVLRTQVERLRDQRQRPE